MEKKQENDLWTVLVTWCLEKTGSLSAESFFLLTLLRVLEVQQPVGGEIRGLLGVVVSTVIKSDLNG